MDKTMPKKRNFLRKYSIKQFTYYCVYTTITEKMKMNLILMTQQDVGLKPKTKQFRRINKKNQTMRDTGH